MKSIERRLETLEAQSNPNGWPEHTALAPYYDGDDAGAAADRAIEEYRQANNLPDSVPVGVISLHGVSPEWIASQQALGVTE